ncbi:MAG: C40 family peptidase, partial [Rhizobiaceae bacterium]
GYVPQDHFETAPDAGFEPATHMVLAPRTFLYSDTDLKSPRSGYRSMGSKLRICGQQTTRGTEYAIVEGGHAIIANHLIQIGNWMPDPVSIAETLLHTPYLWGGNSAFGVDCSGLVSLANLLCGKRVLRDSDMQAQTIGEEIPLESDKLRRGDLVFWKGHVGLMTDDSTLLHANGHSMSVALESLADAITRIGYLYGQPTRIRRP